MKGRFWDAFDYILLICVIILVATGIAFIYSSGIDAEGVLRTNEYIKQIIWAGIGLVFLVFFALYDYRKFERPAQWIYLASILLLIITFLFGKKVNGARSWIGIGEFGIQPSEFTKIVFILMLAKYLDVSINENQIKRFVIAIGIFILPFGLILIQPDMGSASVYIPIFLVMCFVSGIPIRFLIFVMGAGFVTIFFAILPVWNQYIAKNSVALVASLTNFRLKLILIMASALIFFIALIVRKYFHGRRYFYWIAYTFSIITIGLAMSSIANKVLKGYQIQRLIIFMNPDIDRLGTGWNIIQSKIAIGSGGLFGRSFLHGTQSHYRYLPQQSTDFIFSILSEEWGFLGGCFVFLIYLVLMLRTLIIVKNASNRFGMYISAGILGMLMIHFFINVGMVMGIMPITGIPLLFLSYGGSSLLTAMSAIGLLMSINSRKFDFF